MVFEDAHWIDPTTQEVLDLLVARIATPGAAVFTYRPEFAPPWSGEAHVTALALSRLNRKLGAPARRQGSRRQDFTAEVLEQIVAKTDGVPLFVEELTKAVLESRTGTADRPRIRTRRSAPIARDPITLHDSSWRDWIGCPMCSEVAQIGACIGREFPYDLLSAVSPLPQDKLQAALEQLTNAELIFRRGVPPDATL